MGIDNSYAASILKEKGLRFLAVPLDNGWNWEEAVLNIKSIAGKLGIDYESYVLNWPEFYKPFLLKKKFLFITK